MENVVIKNVDFNLLKKQKNILINMIGHWETYNDSNKQKEAKEVEGLLGLIDAIQDYAVDVLGYSEEEIFNLSED